MTLFDEVTRVQAEADCLFTANQVEAALDVLGQTLSARYENSNPVLMCLMKGGLVPVAGLLRRMNFPLELDYLHASRYRNELAGADLVWNVTPGVPLADRHVIIVDDILDEGITLTAVTQAIDAMQPASSCTVVLVHKEHDRKPGLKQADYIGLTVPDRYVFGYGMDYKGYLRNAPGIYAVNGT